MLRFRYITKAKTSPRGKDAILIHAMPEDAAMAERIVNAILGENDGIRYACWLAEDPEKVFAEYTEPEMSEMQIYLPLITERYLETAQRYPDFKMEAVSARGLFVMPAILSPSLIPAYTARFGNIHVTVCNSSDIGEDLRKQLHSLLMDPQLKERIRRHAFTRRLFLSYRKKDRAEALKILKSIHDTKEGAAAETWYDDFLIPGRDFNNEISEAMASSEAVVLSVTPNLMEIHPDGEANYVRAHEYPDAVRTGKPVIPVEAVEVKRDEIISAFPNIPPFIRLGDQKLLEDALKNIPAEKAAEIPDDKKPYLTYLLGMAFYMGFRVEKDVARAIRYLQDAADYNVPEAAEQLFKTYKEGYEVTRDTAEALKWQIRTFEIYKDREPDEKNVRRMKQILFDEGMGGVLSLNGRVVESNEYCQDLIDAIDGIEPEDESQMIIWKAEALLNQGDIDFGNPLPNRSDEVNLQYMLQMTKEAEKCLEDYYGEEDDYYWRVSSMIQSSYSDYERKEKNLLRANQYMMVAVKRMRQSLQIWPVYENRFKMAQMLTNLSGCRYLLSFEKGQSSVMQRNYREDSVMFSNEAIKIYTQLYNERKEPSCADNLAMCYLNKSLAVSDRSEAKAMVQKGLEVIAMLENDYPGEGQGTKRKLLHAL